MKTLTINVTRVICEVTRVIQETFNWH